MTNRIVLPACRPEPLMSYLKALGVFRLVAEQADSRARAAWDGDVFVLHTTLSESDLLTFFAERYSPTPIITPWAGGSGFFEGDDKQAIEKILNSKTPRLEAYRLIIARVQDILKDLGQTTKPQGEAKDHLLRRYRRELPDELLASIDAAIVLQNDDQKYPPILRIDGNDGKLNFTQNLMQRLVEIGFADNTFVPEADQWLRNALFAEPVMQAAIGQYDSNRTGGSSAGQGLGGSSRANPWKYVLMLEGALLIAGSVTPQLDVNTTDAAPFPFTVTRSTVGYRNISFELWLPLWRNPARLNELRQFFVEGRQVQVDKRQASNAVDSTRAIVRLGINRGLTGFVRYSFLRRNSQPFLAISLGRFYIHTQSANTNLLDELGAWLDR